VVMGPAEGLTPNKVNPLRATARQRHREVTRVSARHGSGSLCTQRWPLPSGSFVGS
jgi:hypothetical protein